VRDDLARGKPLAREGGGDAVVQKLGQRACG
jgi:hypothetical protein